MSYPEVKLDIHVFSKAAGVVISQSFGIAECLHKANSDEMKLMTCEKMLKLSNKQ